MNKWRLTTGLFLWTALVTTGEGQTLVDLRTQSKSVDFSAAGSTKPMQTGSSLPSTCAVGQFYFLTTAAAGSNVYACNPINTWTVEGSGLSVNASTTNEVLSSNGSSIQWLALGGDISGAPGGLTVNRLQGRTLSSTAPSGGQVLQWNGTANQWQPAPAQAGNASYAFTAQVSITIPGTVHQFGTANLVVDCYDNSTPPQRVEPDRIQISPATYNVTVNFSVAQSGYCVVNGAGTASVNVGVGAVSSVFGRTGAVLAQSGDYGFGQISGTVAAGQLPSAGGDVSGTLTAATVTGIQSRAVSNTAPSNGQALVWNSGASAWQPGTVSSGGAVSSIFGRTGAVTAQSGDYGFGQISGTVGTGQLPGAGGDVSGTLTAATVTGIQSRAVSNTAPSNGQALVWNSGASAWQPGTVSSGGAVSSIFGRTGAVAAQTGDYTAAQVTNALSQSGSYSDPSWLTLTWAGGRLTGIPSTFPPSPPIYYGSGNVGIGTSTPLDLLSIYGGNLRMGGSGYSGFQVTSSNAYSLDYFNLNALDGSNGIAANFTPNGTPATNAFAFQFLDNGTANTPGFKFIGRNDLSAHIIASDTNGSGSAYPIIFRAGAGNWTALPNVMTIQAGAPANTLVLNSSGSVGIGTATPSQALTVQGNIYATGNITCGGTCGGGGSGGAVSSVFSRSGAVTAQSGDYSFGLISGTVASGQLPAAGGDLSGTLTTATVKAIQGQAVSNTPPSNGQSLVWNAAVSAWLPTTVAGGGGGVTMAYQLGDLAALRASSTVMSIGAGCAPSAPCNVRFGYQVYSITNSASATISAGSGTAYVYVNSAGTLMVGHNLTVACSAGCTQQAGITSFPPNVLPIYTWTATNGTWDSTGGRDQRAFMDAKVLGGGQGIIVTEAPGQSTLAVDNGVIPTYLMNSATLNFSSIANGACAADQSITVAGANPGDAVAPGWPALPTGVLGTMLVSGANTITVRLCNMSASSVTPASASYKATIVRNY
jgi:hypothetical protein